MNYITEPEKKVPVVANVDVLVVGGGPAGLSAAIASARTGAKTMLVERYGCFGGVLTQVGVEGFAWYRHEGTIEAGGLAMEYQDAAQRYGGTSPEPQSTSQAIDAEMFKYVADVLLLEAGVIPLLHTSVADVIIKNNVITGVITESKAGRQAILAKRVIDCSGDADVAALAKVPFTKRDNLAWVTPLFNCRCIDGAKFKDYIYNELKPTYSDWEGEWSMTNTGKENDMFSPFLVDPFKKATDAGLITPTKDIAYGGSYSTISENGDVTQLNVVFMGGIDCTDNFDLTRGEIEGRKACLEAIKALRVYAPGFENAKLRNFGMTLGTRESRQIDGHYHLTGEDVMGEARFEDSIGIFPEFIDGNGKLWIPTTGRYYQIPYRSILPKKVDNLLVAGRSISGDINAHASFRNMSCCVVTGQGAGVAAAISINNDTPVSKVNIEDVQKELEHQGVRIF